MNVLIRRILLIGLSAAVAACAGNPRPMNQQSSGGSGRITRAEMEKVRYANLFDVVQALRSRWLIVRGPKTLIGRPIEIQVVVDEMQMGGTESLRSLNTSNVVSIVFFDPVTATQRWGGKHAQGTIFVTTHADGAP